MMDTEGCHSFLFSPQNFNGRLSDADGHDGRSRRRSRTDRSPAGDCHRSHPSLLGFALGIAYGLTLVMDAKHEDLCALLLRDDGVQFLVRDMRDLARRFQ